MRDFTNKPLVALENVSHSAILSDLRRDRLSAAYGGGLLPGTLHDERIRGEVSEGDRPQGLQDQDDKLGKSERA